MARSECLYGVFVNHVKSIWMFITAAVDDEGEINGAFYLYSKNRLARLPRMVVNSIKAYVM